MRHIHQSQLDKRVRQPHVNRVRRKLQRAFLRMSESDPSWLSLRQDLEALRGVQAHAPRTWGIDGRVVGRETPEGSRVALLEEAKSKGLDVVDSMTKAQLQALLTSAPRP